jgi:hypothetical protein
VRVSGEISFATTILCFLLQLYKIVAMRSLVRASSQVSRDVSDDVPDTLGFTTITQFFAMRYPARSPARRLFLLFYGRTFFFLLYRNKSGSFFLLRVEAKASFEAKVDRVVNPTAQNNSIGRV